MNERLNKDPRPLIREESRANDPPPKAVKGFYCTKRSERRSSSGFGQAANWKETSAVGPFAIESWSRLKNR